MATQCGACETEEAEKFCFEHSLALCLDCYIDEHEECEMIDDEGDGEDEDEGGE